MFYLISGFTLTFDNCVLVIAHCPALAHFTFKHSLYGLVFFYLSQTLYPICYRTDTRKEALSNSFAELVNQVETFRDQKQTLEMKQREIENHNKNLQKKLEGGCM